VVGPLAIFQRMVAPFRVLRHRAYEGATANRWTGDRWQSAGGNQNLGILVALQPMRARARTAVQNNPYAAAGTNAWEAGAVGAGFTPTPQHPNRNARLATTSAYKRWKRRADADGRTDLDGLFSAAFRAMVVDGESLLQFIVTPDGLRLRLIPAELLDATRNVELDGGARIIAGVEFDANDRRIAYWIRPVDPVQVFDTYAPPVRLPADDIIHLFRPLAAGQVRGVTWFAPCLLTIRELDQLLDALLVGAKVAAMHAGFLIDQNGAMTGSPYDGIQVGSIMESGLEPGTLKVLPAGYDIRFSSPAQAQQAIEFAKLTLRGIAAGLGVPEHLMTGDLSGANYSSLRAGMVDFRRRVEAIQFHVLVPQLLQPIWERFITLAVLSGELDAPDFETAAEDYFAVEWIPPAQDSVDPAKDAEATATMIAAGLMSRRQAVAAQGYDIEDLDAEIASDREREARLGLSFTVPVANGQANAA